MAPLWRGTSSAKYIAVTTQAARPDPNYRATLSPAYCHQISSSSTSSQVSSHDTSPLSLVCSAIHLQSTHSSNRTSTASWLPRTRFLHPQEHAQGVTWADVTVVTAFVGEKRYCACQLGLSSPKRSCLFILRVGMEMRVVIRHPDVNLRLSHSFTVGILVGIVHGMNTKLQSWNICSIRERVSR